MENQLVSAFLLENNHIEINYVSDNITNISFKLSKDGSDLPIRLSSSSNVNQVYKLDFVCDSNI